MKSTWLFRNMHSKQNSSQISQIWHRLTIVKVSEKIMFILSKYRSMDIWATKKLFSLKPTKITTWSIATRIRQQLSHYNSDHSFGTNNAIRDWGNPTFRVVELGRLQYTLSHFDILTLIWYIYKQILVILSSMPWNHGL